MLCEAQREDLWRLERELERRRYAVNTRKTYVGVFRTLLLGFPGRAASTLDPSEIERYLRRRVDEDGVSPSYQIAFAAAVRLFHEHVLDREPREWTWDSPERSKAERRVLTRAEVGRMLEVTKNLKHRCILMLMYGSGLRPSELLGLWLSDVCTRRRRITVRATRGHRQRAVPLPDRSLRPLRDYLEEYEPITWVFEGRTPGKPYSARSVQVLVARAATRAGVHGAVTAYMLRHAFAAHLLESGADLEYVSELLGHTGTRSTARYAPECTRRQPGSPLDESSFDCGYEPVR